MPSFLKLSHSDRLQGYASDDFLSSGDHGPRIAGALLSLGPGQILLVHGIAAADLLGDSVF